MKRVIWFLHCFIFLFFMFLSLSCTHLANKKKIEDEDFLKRWIEKDESIFHDVLNFNSNKNLWELSILVKYSSEGNQKNNSNSVDYDIFNQTLKLTYGRLGNRFYSALFESKSDLESLKKSNFFEIFLEEWIYSLYLKKVYNGMAKIEFYFYPRQVFLEPHSLYSFSGIDRKNNYLDLEKNSFEEKISAYSEFRKSNKTKDTSEFGLLGAYVTVSIELQGQNWNPKIRPILELHRKALVGQIVVRKYYSGLPERKLLFSPCSVNLSSVNQDTKSLNQDAKNDNLYLETTFKFQLSQIKPIFNQVCIGKYKIDKSLSLEK